MLFYIAVITKIDMIQYFAHKMMHAKVTWTMPPRLHKHGNTGQLKLNELKSTFQQIAVKQSGCQLQSIACYIAGCPLEVLPDLLQAKKKQFLQVCFTDK